MKNPRKTSAASRPAVVIVDDEKAYVSLMAGMIADNLECDVHEFTRPTDALDRLAEIGAGVVVTDYSMPEMDGIQFIRSASKVVPEAAFVIISGQDLDLFAHELARLKKLRMRLQKPFGWRSLTEAVLKAWPGKDAPGLRNGAKAIESEISVATGRSLSDRDPIVVRSEYPTLASD